MTLLLVTLLVLALHVATHNAFVHVPVVRPHDRQRRRPRPCSSRPSSFSLSQRQRQHRPTHLSMVRNIDLPEALVFYGRHVFQHETDGTLLPGVKELLQECRELQTPVVVLSIVPENDKDKENTPLPVDTATNKDGIVHHYSAYKRSSRTSTTSSSNTPYALANPRALCEAVRSLTIQPRGFGRSSGFGARDADPIRQPLFQHVVVLCDSVDACRAARYVGARVVCLQHSDNDLADAIVHDWSEITMDDIATPGSYWLNPPHPKDDEGNRVDDIEDIIDYYENESSGGGGGTTTMRHDDDDDSSCSPSIQDDEMARILADLDSI